MKKILFFSRDPGGANAIIPVFKAFERGKYNLSIFGKDNSLEIYQKFKINGSDISAAIDVIDLESIISFIKNIDPDLIITGTSSHDKTELLIWQAAKIINIPSMAIMDQWINYGIRFSQYCISEIEEFKKNVDFITMHFPTKVVVMDVMAREEAVKEGVPQEIILICGQPYFETVASYVSSIAENSILEIKNNLSIGENDYVITFASQPFSEIYKNHKHPPYYWGYSEKTILSELIRAVEELLSETNKNITLIVRLHPKENRDNYRNTVNSINNSRIKIFIDDTSSQWDLMAASNLVCGMTSMFLTESVIFKKDTISIQINLEQTDEFILAKKGIMKSITTYKDLVKKLRVLLVDNNHLFCNLTLIQNPVDNIMNKIKNLWQI